MSTATPHCRPPALAAFAAFLFLGSLVAPATSAQDPAADRLYREAQRLEQAGDPSAALEELQLLVQQFPAGSLAPRALLEMVRLRRAAGDVAGARSAIQKLLADYPRTEESAAAFIHQAEIALDEAASLTDLEEARKTFRRVPLLYGTESYPELPERSRARVRSGEIGLLLGDDATAAADFLAVVEDEPPSVWTGRARLHFGTALLRLGRWAAAAEVLQRLASEAPETTASTAGDRDRARHLLSFIHRHFLRPAAGQERWRTTARFPAGTPVREPSAVAAESDGRTLLVDRRARWAAVLDAGGSAVETRTIEDAERPGWGGGETPFVVTESAIELPFEGVRTRFLEPQPGKEVDLKGMFAAERGPFGHWFVLAKSVRGLLIFETPRRGLEMVAGDRPDFVDLARDARGRVYVLDRKARSIGRLDLDRTFLGGVVTGDWRRPVALDVDRVGKIYVLDRGQRTVAVYDPDGRPVTRLGPTLPGGVELRAPVDLAVDGTGRLFIADEKIPFLVVLE